MRATRALVHLDAFYRNFKAVRSRIGQKRQICVPVKADAYGHGAACIARASVEAGASCLGVADAQEGMQLRKEGITGQVLLFSQALPSEIPLIIENCLTPFVSDSEFAHMLDAAALAAKIRLPVHLKIDTGMGRMGCRPQDALPLAKFIAGCAGLDLVGTATHFAAADSAAEDDIAYTEGQISCFNQTVENIVAAGINPGIIHAANSGAVILHPKAWYDMVRPGILLYGYKLVNETNTAVPPLQVEPVMEFRTNVVYMKHLKKGESISYCRTWKAPRDTTIGILAAGYADGLPFLAAGKWQVLINGSAYPMVGRICMDQSMADLGPVPAVHRWDEAVIFGGQALSAADFAEISSTIPYDIVCSITKRVPRVYVDKIANKEEQ